MTWPKRVLVAFGVGLEIWLGLAAAALAQAPVAAVPAGREVSCDDPRPLRLALVPKYDPERLRQSAQPLLQALQRELGRPVVLLPGVSYGAVVEGLLAGSVDLAELGPASYAMVVERQADAVRPFAAAGRPDAQGVPVLSTYRSQLVVREDARLPSLAALRGRSLALIDPASTSGALLPRQAVRELTGEPLEAHFGRVSYAGSHDLAIDAVRRGLVDAAFVSSTRHEEALRRGRLAPRETRVLWQSVPIPNDPFVLRQRLCAPLRQAIERLFLSGDPALRALAAGDGGAVFMPVTDADYRAVRERLNNP